MMSESASLYACAASINAFYILVKRSKWFFEMVDAFKMLNLKFKPEGWKNIHPIWEMKKSTDKKMKIDTKI